MSKTSRRIPLVAAMAFCLLAMFAAVSHANHSWGGYHWARTANPFTLKVGNNLTSNWITPFNTAIADWSNSSVMNLTAVAGTAGRNCKWSSELYRYATARMATMVGSAWPRLIS